MIILYNIIVVNEKITAVVPVFNEENSIFDILDGVSNYCDEIIIVNDGSTDKSIEKIIDFQKLNKISVEIIVNKKNHGIGYSVKKGFDLALENGAGIVLKIDADGQHNPDNIPQFIKLLDRNNLDLVKGNRFFDTESIQNMPKIKIIGNLITTNIQKIVSGNYKISDPNNGFLAVKGDKLRSVNFSFLNNQYFFENSLLVVFTALDFKIGEIGIKTIYRNEKSSIPVFTASIKLFPIFISLLFKKNSIRAFQKLSINSLIFYLGVLILLINTFLNILFLWYAFLILVVVYLFIDLVNFYKLN